MAVAVALRLRRQLAAPPSCLQVQPPPLQPSPLQPSPHVLLLLPLALALVLAVGAPPALAGPATMLVGANSGARQHSKLAKEPLRRANLDRDAAVQVCRVPTRAVTSMFACEITHPSHKWKRTEAVRKSRVGMMQHRGFARSSLVSTKLK